MSKLLEIAISQLGVKEIQGAEDNPAIVNYAKEAGFEWINDDETPWCSIFMNWCAKKAELEASNKANARSWLTVGSSISNPKPGDVVVYWRVDQFSWKGHVGIFVGYDKSGKQIYTLGGNQGNEVSISTYPAQQLLGFRRLVHKDKLLVPNSILTLGDSGREVKLLQRNLISLGYDTGLVDGVFGSKTEAALKTFQTSVGIVVDGVYGENSAYQMKQFLVFKR